MIVLIIIVIILLYYFFATQHFNAYITYADGETVELPHGKWFINADIIKSTKKIWGLRGVEGKTSIATVPDSVRHLLQWDPIIGDVPQYHYSKYFIEV